MVPRDALAEINATLLRQGFSERSAITPEFEGQLKVHGKPVDIVIAIPDVQFAKLPEITLKDKSQLDPTIVGHLFRRDDGGSGICYASAVGLPLDIYNPGGSILRVLELAKEAMEVNYNGRAIAEVAAEYQDYWRDDQMSFRILIDRPAGKVLPLNLGYYRFYRNGAVPFFGLRDSPQLSGFASQKCHDALLLHSDQALLPVAKIKVPNTLADLETWFCGQPGLTGGDYNTAFSTLARGGFVALSAPNCVLGVSLQLPSDLNIGMRNGNIRISKMPLFVAKRKSVIKLTRYGGFWCDQRTLAERNLVGMKTLAGQKIALIGCGTLGSHIAKFLVQSGAGSNAPLYLFDRQSLSPGNIGRHYLGMGAIGNAKSDALRDELKNFHPDVDLRSICSDVVDQWNVAEGCDLIIDATGDWNTQNAVNERILRSKNVEDKAVLFSWVCGNGAAIQSFLSLSGDACCFRCLRPDPSRNWRYTALKPKYEEVIEEATCGDGAYYPYSVAAPAIGAGLATEMILGWANGKSGSRLRTIVIDHERGAERKPTTPTPAATCPACAAKGRND